MTIARERCEMTLGEAEAYARGRAEALAWRPIETAPCDDTWALVYWRSGETMTMDLDHDSDPAWWAERGATHWMPLPAPPHENARARADEAEGAA